MAGRPGWLVNPRVEQGTQDRVGSSKGQIELHLEEKLISQEKWLVLLGAYNLLVLLPVC